MKKVCFALISFCIVVLAVFALSQIYQAFIAKSYSDVAGWMQVLVTVFGIPILYWELSKIRQAIYHKPVIKIGLGNVNDLPISKVKSLKSLVSKIRVSHGYPQFWLVIRNEGEVAAKSVQICFEFSPPKTKSILSPVIEAKDWLNDNRFTFKKINNVDFIFTGGQDWVLHAKDTNTFDFYMTTALVRQTEPREIRESPEIGDYEFICTVWADGLDKPVQEKLVVSIVESL
ncbi:MAG TPA: hypothetical protein PKW33_15550 [Anaerolineaceae bacterium]|nr:hypothetical protein [Anaerolineaceae bacterium]HPN53010.1 hypothetical protein [Anaerolineaceae bacterium]